MPKIKYMHASAVTTANQELRDLIDGRRRFLRLSVEACIQQLDLGRTRYYSILKDPTTITVSELRQMRRVLRFGAEDEDIIRRCIFC